MFTVTVSTLPRRNEFDSRFDALKQSFSQLKEKSKPQHSVQADKEIGRNRQS